MQPKSVPSKKFKPQFKIADMLSMGGAGLIGLGLGASLNEHLVGVIPVFIILGLVLQGLGMYGKIEIEKEHIEPPVWVIVVFGICSIGLMVSGLYILIGRYVVTVL